MSEEAKPVGFWSFCGAVWLAILTPLLIGVALGVVEYAVFDSGRDWERSKQRERQRQKKETSNKSCCLQSQTTKSSYDDRDPLTGKEPTIRIPSKCRVKNRAAKDGLGLNCVACIETAARYQGIDSLTGLTERQTTEKGGGWAEKIGRILDSEKKRGAFDYAQYEDKDFAEHISDALKCGHVPCVTWAGGKHYHGHADTMVCVLYLDPPLEDEKKDSRACVLDPNFPEEVEWMSRDEMLRRVAIAGDGNAWIVTVKK